MRRFAKLALLTCMTLSAHVLRDARSQGPATLPEVTYKRLLNGLQIAAASAPSPDGDMTMGLAIRYGAAFDPAEKGGLAYLAAKMLMQATTDRSAQDIRDELAYLGARIEVHCDWDGIRLTLRAHSSKYERALLLLYQVVGEAQLRDADFPRIKAAVLDELEKPEDPRFRNRLQFERILVRGTTYARSHQGSKPSLQNIQLGDVRLFYRRLFSPSAAVLVIASSAPQQAVIQKATRIWGVWVRKEDVPPTFLPAKPPGARQIYLEDDPSSPAAQFTLGNLWPRREDPRYYPAVLAARLFQERLNKALPTSLISVGADGRRLEGAFYIQGQAAAEQAIREIAKVLEIAETLKEAPVSQEELAEVQMKWIEEFTASMKLSEGICRVLLDAELYRLGTNYSASFADLVNRTTVETIRDTSKEWIFPGGVVILVRGPAATLRQPLEALGTVETVAP